MKVLQIITKGEPGGAQTHLLALCRALSGQIDMTVIIGGSDPADALEHPLADLGIPLLRLPPLRNSLSPLGLAHAVRALWRMLRLQRPDLIHAHSAMAGVVARIAGRLAGIPVVYTVHGFGFKPQAPRRQRLAARLAEWLLAPWTAHMICVSAHERALAGSLPLTARRISVIGNAVQDHPLRANPASAPLRVVMVARCAAPKRHDLLLQALAHVATRQGQEMPATLAGDGPLRATLQQQAHALGLRAVHFAGDVSAVPALLAGHGVFVLMSDHEGLPMSVIEALRCGLPVVASDLPGVRELVTPGREGLLVSNEAEALAQALLELATQPATRARMAVAARARYESQCQPEQMAGSIAAVYGQILRHE